MIKVDKLIKEFGSTHALQSFDLEVQKGECFALLGPNGAGKSTLLKILLGLVLPSSGSASLQNTSVRNAEARKGVAYLPEKFDFYPYYTVEGTLKFMAKLNKVSKEELQKNIDEALESMNILDLKKRKISKLSKGQLQRVGIASTLLGDKELYFFDEPFSGLDPIGIRDFKKLVTKLKEKKKTIFLNSHILSEIENLCESFCIINKGKSIFRGDQKQLAGASLEDFFAEKIGAN